MGDDECGGLNFGVSLKPVYTRKPLLPPTCLQMQCMETEAHWLTYPTSPNDVS